MGLFRSKKDIEEIKILNHKLSEAYKEIRLLEHPPIQEKKDKYIIKSFNVINNGTDHQFIIESDNDEGLSWQWEGTKGDSLRICQYMNGKKQVIGVYLNHSIGFVKRIKVEEDGK